MKDILKLTLFLTLLAMLSAAALSITYIYTSSQIEERKIEELKSALTKALPTASSFKKEKDYYIGLDKKGQKIGDVFTAAPRGYGGAINMVVGIDLSGRVAGVEILEMNETPGLGTKVREDSFLKQFKNKSLSDKLMAKLDIQALTGATVTTQGVADGVREALERFKKVSP